MHKCVFKFSVIYKNQNQNGKTKNAGVSPFKERTLVFHTQAEY